MMIFLRWNLILPVLNQFNENFNPNRTKIYETSLTSNYTSYSINKGEELSFCLRSKSTGKLHDINLLMYVAVHELAHTACPETGHTPLFNKIFTHSIVFSCLYLLMSVIPICNLDIKSSHSSIDENLCLSTNMSVPAPGM